MLLEKRSNMENINNNKIKDFHAGSVAPDHQELIFQYHTKADAPWSYTETHKLLVDMDCVQLLGLLYRHISCLEAHEVLPWIASVQNEFSERVRSRLNKIAIL